MVEESKIRHDLVMEPLVAEVSLQLKPRISRFHTASGKLCVNPIEICFAFVTTVMRKLFNYRLKIPFLILPALRFLSKEIVDKEIFEYGSGNSTLWYADRCKRIIAIEDSREWYDIQIHRMGSRRNVQVFFELDRDRYISKTRELGLTFDIVIVDGSYRLKCLEISIEFVRPGGYLVIDNTDQIVQLKEFVRRTFPARNVTVLSGYALGNFYAKETTIVHVI